MATLWPTARDLMTPDPVTVPPESPLSRALGLMRNRAIHELPVLRGKRLLGMITFESIARRTNLPLSTKVQHLLLLPPLITQTMEYPEIAQQLLAAGLRAAPVVGRRGELLGILSRTDLVRVLPDLPSISRHVVEDFASPVGLTLRETAPSASLFGHIRLLEEHPLPVVDRRGRLVGAVGVADLGRILWRPMRGGKKDALPGRKVFGVEIGTIMNSPPLTVPLGTSAGIAARRMATERVSSVFVVDNGRPVGVVSQTDLLGLAVGESGAGQDVGDVYVQVHGLRGSGDPELMTEIDRLVAKGLKHVQRHVRSRLLSLHITPQGTHRTGDAAVQARLYSDEGTFYASQTGWNLFAGISNIMDELAEQTRRARDGRRRGAGARRGSPTDADVTADPELEAKIRTATGRDAD